MSDSPPSLFRVLYQHLPDAVFLIDFDTSNIVDANAAAVQQVGYSVEELRGHSVLSLQKDVSGEVHWASIAQAICEAGQGFLFAGAHVHKSGADVPVEVASSCFEHEGRHYVLSIARDISRRQALALDQSSREAQLHFALTAATDGMWDWHVPSSAVYFSPQLKRLLGYGPHEMEASLESWSGNVHPDDVQRVQAALRAHLAGERERYEAAYRLRNRNGHYLWVQDRGQVYERDAQGKAVRVVGMVQNITDQKHTEETLHKLAVHDALTGLLNRRECDRVLPQQLERCRRLQVPLGVCLFDLDHYKQVNDRFGHQVGDTVLREFANLLRARVRTTDLLFRWGGEEFLMVTPGVDATGLLQLAQDLRRAIEAHDWPGCPGLGTITCSFGLATFPEHGETAEALFLAADAAMYRAKVLGRNRVEMAQLPQA